MDKFLVPRTPGDYGGPNETPRIKRGLDNFDSPLESSKKPKITAKESELLRKNYYSPLADDNGDIIAPTIKTRRTREPRLPPITLHQKLTNPKATYEKIQSWASKPVYFKQVGDVRHIYATLKDDFVKIKEQLKAINFLWTGHKAEDDMHRKLVLKGIDKSYTESEIFDDLKRQFDTVAKVKQLTTKNKEGEHIPIGVFLVYFEWDTILSVPMKTIKYCCYHKISWHHFRTQKTSQVKQCYNCQGFGHYSSDCGLKNRCVKCVDEHSPGKCVKVKGTDDAVCCNCGGKHPASYKGCVKAKEYLANARKPQKPARKDKPKEVNGVGYKPNVIRELTFSDAVRGQKKGVTPRQKPVIKGSGLLGTDWHPRGQPEVSNGFGQSSGNASGTKSFSFITNEINSLFGVPISELMDTVNAFMPVYRRCTDITTKKLLLLELLSEISR